MTSTDVFVTATRWKLGWELELDSGGVTQVRTLATAAQQVRDYLDTVEPDVDHTGWSITIIPEIGPALDAVKQARAATDAAQVATKQAARQTREAVRGLREQGLSVADTAAIMGLSRGRVSQLMAA